MSDPDFEDSASLAPQPDTATQSQESEEDAKVIAMKKYMEALANGTISPDTPPPMSSD